MLRSRLRVLQCARSEMQHFLDVLRGYIFVDVLDAAWTKLQAALQRATSWVDMRQRHREYIQHVHRACFRTQAAQSELEAEGEDVRKGAPSVPSVGSVVGAPVPSSVTVLSGALDQILSSMIDLVSRVSQVETSIHQLRPSEWMTVLAARDRFRNFVQFLVQLMHHQQVNRTQATTASAHRTTAAPTDLLHRLDFNRFYQLRAKE
jgi:hypothetical protein